MPVRVRFPPSPSGELHIGNVRTALFNWLYARHEGGSFILRIEDTDQSRVVPGSIESIIEALQWLGLDWDEGPDPKDPSKDIGHRGPYVQSRRLHLYREAADRLVAEGHAYYCFCSPERLDEIRKEQQAHRLPPKYDRHCRDLAEDEKQRLGDQGKAPVVRFRTPLAGQTSFFDVIRGELTFENDTLDDFVLLRADGFPVYHLASVVDDHLMDITHVMRGDDWVSSTPRHALLYEALGWDVPVFAHLPMILGPDGSRLGKRHGATSALEFRKLGYLPEVMFNFLGLLGWSLDDRTEIIDRETFIRHFTLDRVLKSSAIFNPEKLTWMNGVYIRALPVEDLARRIRPFLEAKAGPVDQQKLLRVVPLIQERIKALPDAVDMADFFFTDGDLEYQVKTLLGKRFADAPADAATALEAVAERLKDLDPWQHEAIEGRMRPLSTELGYKAGDLFGLTRVAVTGKTATPPLFETMEVLGRDRTLQRLNSAIERLIQQDAQL